MSLLDAILLEPPKQIKEVWVARRNDGNKGTGTRDDPYNGGTQALFDDLMREFEARGLEEATIHIGPGLFETQGTGGGEAGVGWTMRRGWRLVGSGMDVTVVRLVGVADSSKVVVAIGSKRYNDRADHAEVSDLTVDCNLPGNPGMAVGAVSLVGSHTRIRRVRAIEFGTETSVAECFVLTVAGAHPELDQQAEIQDCVIEDCICDRPSENNSRETTVLLVGSGEIKANGLMAHPRACVLRNNSINCIHSRNEAPIQSIAFAGATATVTTKIAHGRNTGDWVAISDAHLHGALDTSYYNGTFQITRLSDTQFTYGMTGTPPAAPTGRMFVDRYPSHKVSVNTLTAEGTTATLTTHTPHFRRPMQKIRVASSDPAEPAQAGDPDSRPFYGWFTVTHVENNRQLQYVMSSAPTGTDEGFKFIGVEFQALTNGGAGAVIEGNRVSHCRIGIYHDTWSKKFLVARNNLFSDVNTGYFENLGGVSTLDGVNLRPGQSLQSACVNGEHVATFTTLDPHGLVVDQAVRIVADPGYEAYAGFVAVAAVPSPTTFTYTLPVAPSSSSASGPKFGALWQVGRVVFENNVIELHPPISGFGPPRGIELADLSVITQPESIFRNVVIRGNLIRHFDESSIPEMLAIRLAGCERALVEGNTIHPELERPMDFFRSQRVAFFDNRTVDGTLLRGVNSATETKADELTTRIEDSLLLAL